MNGLASSGVRSSLSRSAAAARVLQGVIDVLEKENLVEADGVLTRETTTLVTGVSFWAYRALTQGWAALAVDGEGYIEIGRAKLQRALELTRILGPTGELCLACVRDETIGEDAAAQAEYQLRSGIPWEPVPVCREHEERGVEVWGMSDDVQLEPLISVWPPWSIAPTWSNRLPEIFSHERFGYAAWQQALQGNVDGMYLSGMCYEVGLGMQRSVDAALYWYKLAASAGYPGAASGVARCERRGPWEQEKEAKSVWWKH